MVMGEWPVTFRECESADATQSLYFDLRLNTRGYCSKRVPAKARQATRRSPKHRLRGSRRFSELLIASFRFKSTLVSVFVC